MSRCAHIEASLRIGKEVRSGDLAVRLWRHGVYRKHQWNSIAQVLSLITLMWRVVRRDRKWVVELLKDGDPRALVVCRGIDRLGQCGAASLDLGDDLFRGLDPDEGFGVVVPV